ncbi:MAG TPA: hypothetical protein VF950_00165 [Planctomycetota bacterium]
MILLAALLSLPLQDDLDARLDALAGALAADGASDDLAELLKSEFGRQAVRERIDSIVAARTARLDRDPQSPYEDWFFARDERGAFRLRPERRAEMEKLAAATSHAKERMAPFSRRCDAFVARISGEGEMEKRARAVWSNPEYRAAYFNLRAAELQEPPLASLLHEIGDGEEELKARLEEMAPLTGSYFKQAAKVPDDAVRARLVSENGVLIVLGRVLRQAAEGSEVVLGRVSTNDDGGKEVAFNVPLAELAPLLRDVDAAAAELAPLLEKRPPAHRVLLAEAALALREAGKAVADNVFAEVVEDGFEAAGDTFRVKKGRFVDGDSNESPDTLEAEYRSTIDVFRGSRTAFDQLLELCADPAEAAPFADLPATFIAQEHQARVVEELREAIQARAFDLFADLYLEKKGDRWAVRPARAARIDEMVKRANEIKKENQ